MSRGFGEILGLLRPGYNHKVIIQLLSKIQLLIFCAPSFILPFERIDAKWKVESRKLDKITFYNNVKNAIKNAITQLEIEKKQD